MAQDERNDVERLVRLLARLPGVGARTARRFVYYLIDSDRQLMRDLGHALIDGVESIQECMQCAAWVQHGQVCSVCSDQRREQRRLCIVATMQDQIALENTGAYRGLYHILHGTLSPLEGVGPDDLRITLLLQRLQNISIDEIILATPPTVDGEATALYLARLLRTIECPITRIASGVPVGGDLQFVDRSTLATAFKDRRKLDFQL